MRRWFGVSTYPPVPMTWPSEKNRIPASSVSAVASITESSATCRAAIAWGMTWTWSVLICSPQIGTLATPGTLRRRDRIVQYAASDMSVTDIVCDVMPIFITRLVAESGWSIIGGAAQVGSDGVTAVIRS